MLTRALRRKLPEHRICLRYQQFVVSTTSQAATVLHTASVNISTGSFSNWSRERVDIAEVSRCALAVVNYTARTAKTSARRLTEGDAITCERL
jgi:hypothetical protein